LTPTVRRGQGVNFRFRGIPARGLKKSLHMVFPRYLYFRGISVPKSSGLQFPFPQKSRVMAKNFTSLGISAGFPFCRHKDTAQFPSRKSRLIGIFSVVEIASKWRPTPTGS
jgi:hypothetical protein